MRDELGLVLMIAGIIPASDNVVRAGLSKTRRMFYHCMPDLSCALRGTA